MSDCQSLLLSIVTPAYNRGHLLQRCCNSLTAQTDTDFEWIIIDDGSTDDTEAVVKSFPETYFPVTYVKKENGGKHTALNASHWYIHGRYVLILDSDDMLTPDAVERVRAQWDRYADNEDVGIVTFLKGCSPDEPNCIVRDWNTPVDILSYERIPVKSTDCCEVIRAELFRKFPFPVFTGEKFVAECALWNRVAQTHKCVYINRVIYICEYLEDGLTSAGRAMRIKNPNGGMFTSNLRMVRKNSFKMRVKYGMLYTCYGFFAKKTVREMKKDCCAKALMYMCLPFGWALYIMWKKRYGGK
jgi:glycosyltransferase involved in cell wall biosynthesis